MSRHRGQRQATWLIAVGVVLLLGGAVWLVRSLGDGGGEAAGTSVVSDSSGSRPATQPITRPAEATGSADQPEPSSAESADALVVSEPSAGPDGTLRAGEIAPGTPKARRARQASPRRAAFVPRTVRFGVASDGASTRVDTVKTLANDSLELPEDPSRLGWWSGGSQAGAPYGSVVLAGHLDSRYEGLGFAARMTELRVGDSISVARDERRRRYEVDKVYLLPRTRLAALSALFSDRGDARLVLLTCGGRYDREARAYSDNLVVEATPIG